MGEIQDVYDGRLYMDEQDFFSCPSNLSLTMNYDGAPKFRSSGMQVWPVQFIINELHHKSGIQPCELIQL